MLNRVNRRVNAINPAALLHLRPRYGQKSKLQDVGGGRHLEFLKSLILGPSDPCMANNLSANQIWCKSVQKLVRYTCLCISKMAAVRHLGFVLP